MRRFGAGLAATVVISSAAMAQGISLNRPGSGARAAGMGNAFIAVSDDGTAASWNPAGLSQLRRPELSVVYNGTRREYRYEGFRALDRTALFTSLSKARLAHNLEFASAALPFAVLGKQITLQAGWRRLYDFTGGIEGDITRIPTSTSSRPESVIHLDSGSDGHINVATVAGAVRLSNRLSLGIGADFYRGRWSDRESTRETPGFVDPIDSALAVGTNTMGGQTFNVGLLLAYPKVRFGVVYHAPVTSAFELTRMTRSNLAPPIDERADKDAGITVQLPRSIGAGVAWVPRPLLRLALDLTFNRWTEFEITGSPDVPGGSQNGFDGLPRNLTATRNTLAVNAGMERLFPVAGRFVPLRLGLSYEPQGARDPLLRLDTNHKVVAAGTGLNSNAVKLDVALEYRWGRFDQSMSMTPIYQVGRGEEVGLPLPPEAQGTVAFREVRLKVSMIYRIARRERAGS